ncbi:MAG: hypothetical protein RMK29_18230 [Myxococcales bacterium]|nr:hypothetical protein [Myxococcota bacterium]MDW8283650.1 hypothetical protein [Myxococcales bacterium]
MRDDLARLVAHWERNHARYEAVASGPECLPGPLRRCTGASRAATSTPTSIRALPWGQPARRWPRNIPVPHNWEDAAVHALDRKRRIRDDLGLTAATTDIAAMATRQPRQRPRPMPAGSQAVCLLRHPPGPERQCVRDHVYDPQVRDRQLGVVAMLWSLPAAPPAVAAAPPPGGPPPVRRPALPPRRRSLGRRGGCS